MDTDHFGKVFMDLNKAKGVIYGLAIGDALGRPTEFLSSDLELIRK